MKMQTCDSCGADVFWLKTPRGKKIPVNADTISKEKPDECTYEPNMGEICHFDTCQQRRELVDNERAVLIARYKLQRGYL